MAFVRTEGGKKKIQARFVIRSKGKTKAKRKKELSGFKAGLKALKNKYQ